MMYASASRGFKAGGFFASGNASDLVGNQFDPETLTAFAFGSKNRFNGDRVQLNGEVFFWITRITRRTTCAVNFDGRLQFRDPDGRRRNSTASTWSWICC
jgi:outer membrane receptor protein involved in Fe transport